MRVDFIDFSNNLYLYVTCTDWGLVQDEMEKFNRENEDCFDYLESMELDGVCFSKLSAFRASDAQIFMFAIQYSARIYSDLAKERGFEDECT